MQKELRLDGNLRFFLAWALNYFGFIVKDNYVTQPLGQEQGYAT